MEVISCRIARAAPNQSASAEPQQPSLYGVGQENRLYFEPSRSHLYSFRIGYWLLTVIGAIGFSLFSTWNVVAIGVLSARYGVDDEAERDWLFLIIHIVPFVTAPLFGIVLDRNHKFYTALCAAGILGLIGHLVMALQFKVTESPTLSLLFLGFGAGMFAAALWPSIAFLCDAEVIAMGYAVMMALNAICYSVSELVITELVQRERSATMYDFVCFYLIALSVVYTLISGILVLWKKDDDHRLRHYQSIAESVRSLTVDHPTAAEDEGGDGVDETACTLMGVVDSNASTRSLFSSEDEEERGRVSETMLGFAGEHEKVVINGHDTKEELMNSTKDIEQPH